MKPTKQITAEEDFSKSRALFALPVGKNNHVQIVFEKDPTAEDWKDVSYFAFRSHEAVRAEGKR